MCEFVDTWPNMSTLSSVLTATPCPLIALIGLDSQERHFHIWKAFSGSTVVSDSIPTNSNSGPSGERLPLRWLLLNDVATLPSPKPKRATYEWFIPKGILKTNWMNKHLNVLPAVAVIFMELDWNDQNWSEKKSECASRVQALRQVLQGRATKIAVVLLQSEATLPDTASNSTEKAADLCSSCELSPRSLFVLPAMDFESGVPKSDSSTLTGFVVRLENAFYELAQNYYHQLIKNVKSHRDFLNKTTHLSLFIRHQFKAGFFNELKRDPHTAYKHYQQAYSLLMEVRATDTNIMEVKTVAGFINYKICRLGFQLNLPRDAISQYRRHMDIFKHKVGAEALAFEHSAWQSDQSKIFAEVFSNAIRHGLPAIQTQHPGLYYQQAAQFAIARRKLSDEICADVHDYPSPDPMANEDTLEFYGQRPWRPGKVSIEPPDVELERVGVLALQFREKSTDHSRLIVDLLSKAIEQYLIFRSPRSQSHLSVQMAEELMVAQRYDEALDLLKPILHQYRKQGWTVLLTAALSLAMKCAFLTARVEDYFAFGLELSKSSNSQEDCVEKERIMSNLCKILSANGQIPSAEPGLTTKQERAAVGNATKLWTDFINSSPKDPLSVKIDFDAAKNSSIQITPVFCASKLKADENAKLICYVKNDTPASESAELAIPIRKVQVIVSNDVDKKNESRVILESSEALPSVLFPGKTSQVQFEYHPTSMQVGNRVFVDKVILGLGQLESKLNLELVVTLHDKEATELAENIEREFFSSPFQLPVSSDVTDSMSDLELSGPSRSFSKIDVEQRTSKLNIEIVSKSPILVNEWFVVTVRLTNNEDSDVQDLTVSASLADASDPLISDTTRLVLDYRAPEPATPVTPVNESEKSFLFSSPPAVKKVSIIRQSETLSVRFYIRASTTAQRNVNFAVEYNVDGFKCTSVEALHLETVEPFVVGSEILSLPRQLPMSSVFSDEPFLLVPELRSLSRHELKVLDTRVEVRHPVKKVHELPSQLSGCYMDENSIGNEAYPLVVHKSDLTKNELSSTFEELDVTVGRYIVKWIRQEFEDSGFESDPDFVSISTFELSAFRVMSANIFASTFIASPFAIVRTPLQVTYTLINRSERVQEFVLTMEPSEAFMLSGNKQVHFKLLPNGGRSEFHYILYPLLPGEAVPFPLPRLTTARVSQHAQEEEVAETLERLLLTHITVLPRQRDKDSADVISANKINAEKYIVDTPVTLKNLPFLQVK